MTTLQRFSLLLVFALPFISIAQHNTGETVPYRLKTIPWSVGLGVNAINLDSKPGDFFASTQSYIMLPAPSRVSGLYHFRDFLEFEGALTANRYRYNEINRTYINDTMYYVTYTPKVSILVALDVNAQFSIPGLNNKTRNFFKPYLALGAGGTFRQDVGFSSTTNVGIGFYSWFTYNWGIQFQALAKLHNGAPFFDNNSNYLQHSFSLMYHFGGDPKNNNNFSKAKHPGTKKKYKFKPDKNAS